LAYLLAESVSHQPTKHEREFVAHQLQEFVAAVAEDFADARAAGKAN
jgi:hypothetical protein